LVRAGHYQRFTATLSRQDVPMIISGAGGYNAKLHVLHRAFHTARLAITMPGAEGVLENFNDSQHGYLRIKVTKKALDVEYVAVPAPRHTMKGPLKAFDAITIKTKY
jgi:hypothetical protein